MTPFNPNYDILQPPKLLCVLIACFQNFDRTPYLWGTIILSSAQVSALKMSVPPAPRGFEPPTCVFLARLSHLFSDKSRFLKDLIIIISMCKGYSLICKRKVFERSSHTSVLYSSLCQIMTNLRHVKFLASIETARKLSVRISPKLLYPVQYMDYIKSII